MKLLLLLILLTGCLNQDVNHDGTVRITCIGDSNTWSGWPTPDGEDRWCRLMIPAATAMHVTMDSPVAPDGYTLSACFDPTLSPVVGDGLSRVNATKASTDYFVVALGTNDLRVLHRTPEEIVACLQQIVDAAAPLRVLIATIPPMFDSFVAPEMVNETNALIAATFPATDVMDFTSGFDISLFRPDDGVHLNHEGQVLRANRAVVKF